MTTISEIERAGGKCEKVATDFWECTDKNGKIWWCSDGGKVCVEKPRKKKENDMDHHGDKGESMGLLIEVTLPDGRRVHARPQQFRVSAADLDVILDEPPGGFTAKGISDWIDIAIQAYKLVKGDGGGGGGGGGQKCTQTITSTTKPDGTISTTITTTCGPA